MAFDAEKMGDDDALLALYAGGDRAAPRLMTERFLPLTYRLALRFLNDRAEAEDVAQEAMVRLFRMAPGWQPGQAKVTTWLYRVTANLCTDRLRRRPALNIDEVPEMADGAPSAEERLTAGARATALTRHWPACQSGSAWPWCCAISKASPIPRSRRYWRSAWKLLKA